MLVSKSMSVLWSILLSFICQFSFLTCIGYNNEDQKVPLPLGKSFQEHLNIFIKNSRKQTIAEEYAIALKLIDNL